MRFLRWFSGYRVHQQCRRHRRCGFDPWVRKIPWRRARQPTPVFLPGESHGQRSPAGYSSWDHKESNPAETTEHACTHTPSFTDKCKAGDGRSYSADTTCKDLKVSKAKRKESFPGGSPTLSTQGPSSFQQLPGTGALWPPVLPVWRLLLSREPGR